MHLRLRQVDREDDDATRAIDLILFYFLPVRRHGCLAFGFCGTVRERARGVWDKGSFFSDRLHYDIEFGIMPGVYGMT